MSSRGWMVVGAAWSSLVFGGVFWLTFPSEAMARRLSYQVGQVSHGHWKLEVANVKPWWLGLSADNVVLSTGEGATAEPVLFADAAGLRVGLFGLLRRQPTLDAYVRLGKGELDVEAKTSLADKKVKSLAVNGARVPIEELLGLIPGGSSAIAASGAVDLDIDLSMGAGLGKADGTFSLTGRDLSIDKVSSERLGWTDKELAAGIDELDLVLTFDEGKGKVERGLLSSSLAEVEIEGDVDLDDEVGRTRIDLKLVADVKDWTGTPLESFRSILDSAMRSAIWADNKAHYDLDTTIGRFSLSDLRATRERGARPVSGATTAVPTPTALPTPGLAPTAVTRVPTESAPSGPVIDGSRAEDGTARSARGRRGSAILDDRALEEEDPPVEDPPEERGPPPEDDPPPPEDEGPPP